MSEGVAEGDAGRGGSDEFAGVRAVKHSGLSSHEEESNTESAEDTESTEGDIRIFTKNLKEVP